jgi:hypothetical protein
MNRDDPDAAAELLAKLDACGRGRGGYLLGDATHDSNPLHAACAPRGVQLLAPRKRPGTGLGHREHEPGRLRAVQILEWPVRLGTGPSPFARDLYACRQKIERRLGTLCTFGGGLQPLPAWVRRPYRERGNLAIEPVMDAVTVDARAGSRSSGDNPGTILAWHSPALGISRQYSSFSC